MVVGFAGVGLLMVPTMTDPAASTPGLAMAVVATFSYGIAYNVAAPLQRRYGVLPVVRLAEIGGAVLLTPVAFPHLAVPSGSSALAVVGLGLVGTAAAFVGFVRLIGLVGPTGASLSLYFVPVVAMALGVAAGDDVLTLGDLVGTGVVVAGAAVASSPARAGRGVRRGAYARSRLATDSECSWSRQREGSERSSP